MMKEFINPMLDHTKDLKFPVIFKVDGTSNVSSNNSNKEAPKAK